MRGSRSLVVVLAVLLAGFGLYRLLSNDPGSDPADTKAAQAATSKDYADLVSLFGDFRSFQQGVSGNIQSYSQSGWILSNLDTAPDFSATAMAEKYSELRTFQERLESIDPSDWPISQQADYHLVRAETNGYEFQHRVLSPWSRDPGFYNDVIATLGYVDEPPLQGIEVANLQSRLRSVPDVVQQAKENLDDFSVIAADLATLAVLSIGDSRSAYQSLAQGLRSHHPEIEADVEAALAAIDDYEQWIRSNEHRMKGTTGVGRENYNWLLRNVYLVPYT